MARRHSPQEINSKLHQAEEMSQLGKSETEIARTLGVSVMIYRRWRVTRGAEHPGQEPIQPDSEIDNLRLENARLRRLVADLTWRRRGFKRS